VDLEAFHASHERTKDTLLFLGRTLEDKGIRDFVHVAKELRSLRESLGVRVVVAGAPDPTNPTSLSALELDALRASGHIDQWGFERDIPGLLSRTALLLFPSFREGFPKAVMEASAAGVPVVGYDVPGVRHAVVHGETGELVRFRDKARLVEVVRTLLLDNRRMREFAENSLAHAAARFDERAIARSVVELYGCAAGEQ
jgi:glycosyltransferase involved in cell wall biosynthesis